MKLFKEVNGKKYAFDQNMLSGKMKLAIDGEEYKNVGRKDFELVKGEEKKNVTVKGSFLSGITLQVQGEEDVVLCKNKWYEWILIFFPLVGIAVGVFGGAIGGFLSALFCMMGAFFNASIVRSKMNIALKVLCTVLIGLVANAIWFGIYLLIAGGIMSAFPNLFK